MRDLCIEGVSSSISAGTDITARRFRFRTGWNKSCNLNFTISRFLIYVIRQHSLESMLEAGVYIADVLSYCMNTKSFNNLSLLPCFTLFCEHVAC